MSTQQTIICDLCKKEIFTNILSKHYRIEQTTLINMFRPRYDIDVCDICMSKIITEIKKKK